MTAVIVYEYVALNHNDNIVDDDIKNIINYFLPKISRIIHRIHLNIFNTQVRHQKCKHMKA